MERPKQPWSQFVKSMPQGRAPGLKEIADRWDEYEDVKSRGDDGAEKVIGRRAKEVGEQRAYLAYLTGAMEEEEQRYFGMLNIRVDQLVLLAIVPTLRDLVASVANLRLGGTLLSGSISEAE